LPENKAMKVGLKNNTVDHYTVINKCIKIRELVESHNIWFKSYSSS